MYVFVCINTQTHAHGYKFNMKYLSNTQWQSLQKVNTEKLHQKEKFNLSTFEYVFIFINI